VARTVRERRLRVRVHFPGVQRLWSARDSRSQIVCFDGGGAVIAHAEVKRAVPRAVVPTLTRRRRELRVTRVQIMRATHFTDR
jgi:hypothetical protein